MTDPKNVLCPHCRCGSPRIFVASRGEYQVYACTFCRKDVYFHADNLDPSVPVYDEYGNARGQQPEGAGK